MKAAKEYKPQQSRVIQNEGRRTRVTSNPIGWCIIQYSMLRPSFHRVIQLMQVTHTDIGSCFNIIYNGQSCVGKLIAINYSWCKFELQPNKKIVSIQDRKSIISKLGGTQFWVSGISFNQPLSSDFKFTQGAALNAIKAPTSGWGIYTTRHRQSGVSIGDIGSYGVVRYLEKPGDGLTGDHQPSGAAIREAVRIELHGVIHPLTRQMAKNAYDKAITIVVEELWHRRDSRTFGGRNNTQQIKDDAANLLQASIEDWKSTVPHLKAKGFSDKAIQDLWDNINKIRTNYFQTGDPQWFA